MGSTVDSKKRERKDTDSREDTNEKETEKGLVNKDIPDDIIDVITEEMSSKRIVDTQTYISETQARVWKALKRGLQFEATIDRSDRFLRRHVNTKRRFVVLVADLVGSTTMIRTLPVERLAKIIQAFSQEMSFTISNFEGYVLKYVGDAVIAYFPADTGFYIACDTALNCARSMLTILEQGINPVLHQYDYPELNLKIGIDAGVHSVIQYGQAETSHVDILGYAISMASKINAFAQPDQIVISETMYKGIHPSIRSRFSEVELDSSWNYTDENTGEIYRLYAFDG
ncbi:MAG: adenylate/guanylate cyclase domain-containing protein [Nitrososphaerales archaeon]